MGRRRGRTNAAQQRAIQEWEREHGSEHDPEEWTRKLLPIVSDVQVRQLVKATGLSLRYCSLVRRGERVPHPIQWGAFANAGQKGLAPAIIL